MTKRQRIPEECLHCNEASPSSAISVHAEGRIVGWVCGDHSLIALATGKFDLRISLVPKASTRKGRSA